MKRSGSRGGASTGHLLAAVGGPASAGLLTALREKQMDPGQAAARLVEQVARDLANEPATLPTAGRPLARRDAA